MAKPDSKHEDTRESNTGDEVQPEQDELAVGRTSYPAEVVVRTAMEFGFGFTMMILNPMSYVPQRR